MLGRDLAFLNQSFRCLIKTFAGFHNGTEGSWAFVAWGWTQSLLAAIFGYRTVNSDWANIEGVKATAEGYVAPIIFLILNTILLINMGDILYG